MLKHGSSVRNMKHHQKGTHANQYQLQFYCGNCVGAPLACNLTGPSETMIYLSHIRRFLKHCQLAKKLAATAMPLGEDFQPEAAIVNYFGLGDMLGGTWMTWKLIGVSLFLGWKAIFLLGGKLREDPPLAMFLRSGDVVLMAGEARECFHGVPRIFTDAENAEILPLEQQLSHEDDSSLLEYIQTSRININIRQVF
ncbi:hypothetical protein ACLB2K_042452 [Fragaria x ananassa]